jgi:hypothetical protein
MPAMLSDEDEVTVLGVTFQRVEFQCAGREQS